MSIIDIDTALQTVARVVNEIKDNVTNYYTTKSLTEVTKLTRVEPLTILSKDCLNLEYIGDVNQSLLSMFCGYYLQAVSILTKVNDVEVVRILDKLNPDRDETGFLFSEKVSRESMVIPSMESYKYRLPNSNSLSLESDEKDNADQINNISNLSVGKQLNVEIAYSKESTQDVCKVKLPINVRLMVSLISNSTIEHLLTIKKEDTSLVERFHAWRGGRISFIKDLIFCQDLIDEYKKAMIEDETSTMVEIMRRVNNSKKYGVLTKNPSMVSASNLFVISEEVARNVEQKLGGKLSNPRIREKAFDNTYAMIIAVIDREYERVTFYTRGISSYTDLSIKEIKNANKGGKGGPDIMDFLKSYTMGNSPAF